MQGAVRVICLAGPAGPGLGPVRQVLLLRHWHLLGGVNSVSKIDMQRRDQRHEFASDNTAAICPEVLAALEEANQGAADSYGDDEGTSRVRELVRDVFETDCDTYLVFNGTAANALALAQLCQPFHSVVCHTHATFRLMNSVPPSSSPAAQSCFWLAVPLARSTSTKRT